MGTAGQIGGHVTSCLWWTLSRRGAQLHAEDKTSLTVANDLAVRRALEAAGVEFIDENGGGPGLRLRTIAKPWLIYFTFSVPVAAHLPSSPPYRSL